MNTLRELALVGRMLTLAVVAETSRTAATAAFGVGDLFDRLGASATRTLRATMTPEPVYVSSFDLMLQYAAESELAGDTFPDSPNDYYYPPKATR